VVTGTLPVLDGLPTEGEPGQVDPDTVRRSRGLSLKVLGVDSEKLRADWTSQDFLFNTWPIIPQSDVKTYLDLKKARIEHFGRNLKISVGRAVRHPTPKQTLFDLTPNVHSVAHTYDFPIDLPIRRVCGQVRHGPRRRLSTRLRGSGS
jgi:hypothetical protein